MKVLISILSDYLQPNFLLIKEFKNKYDKLLFFTTSTMESSNKQKSLFLIKALNIRPELVTILNIKNEEDNYNKLIEIIDQQHFSKNDEYILNLTGGTKIIPMAIFNYFNANNYNAKSYYVPIGKNIIKSVDTSSEQPIKYKMNLKEYFDLQGLQFETSNEVYPESYNPEKVYKIFKSRKYQRTRDMYPKYYSGQTDTSPLMKKFLCGEWFEEYCYNRLKSELNLPDDAITKGARLFRVSPDEQNNEVDVMFVKDNNLYFFECKIIKMDWDSNSVNDYIYKLAAITKNYGLRVNSYLLTLSDMNHTTKKYQQLINKTNLLGVKKVFGFLDFEKDKLDL